MRVSRWSSGVAVTAVAAGVVVALPAMQTFAVAAPSGTLESTSDGYSYRAGTGQDNEMVVTAGDAWVEFHDKAVASFAAVPAECEPVSVEEGASVTCPRTGAVVLEFRLADGADLLDGSALPADAALRFVGGAGDNVVLGGGGDDVITGGDDDVATDTLYGGPGDDIVRGRSGSSYLRGHSGDDLLVGGPSLDFIIGDGGADTADGRGGIDYIVGNSGADRLEGGPDFDNVDGDRGRDVLLGRGDGDVLYGGPGRDRLRGGAGPDELYARGDRRRDVARCGRGNDIAHIDGGQTDSTRRCETVIRKNP